MLILQNVAIYSHTAFAIASLLTRRYLKSEEMKKVAAETFQTLSNSLNGHELNRCATSYGI